MAKILLADDDQDIRMMVRLLLSVDKSLDVVAEATTPGEAIAFAEQHQPDLIVLDQGFRGDVTGLEIAPTIKEKSPATKIILFTAYESLEHSAADVKEIDGFLLKTRVKDLVDMIQKLVGPTA